MSPNKYEPIEQFLTKLSRTEKNVLRCVLNIIYYFKKVNLIRVLANVQILLIKAYRSMFSLINNFTFYGFINKTDINKFQINIYKNKLEMFIKYLLGCK